MRPTILITKPLVKSCMDSLKERFDTVSILGEDDPEAVMTRHAARIRAIAGGKVSARMMELLPNLELIANEGVGVDTTDIAAAKARGIAVTNTPDVLNGAVAELAVGLMLALSRNLPQADSFIRNGQWPEGAFPLCSELAGKTAGILGLGRIGKEIAARLSAFGMKICYCGRNLQPDQPYTYIETPLALADAVDWLVVIAPGGKATEGIVSRQVIEALGPKGRLVNVARGSLVDQEALITALQSGGIAGAALDVFADEPDVPQALQQLENVVLSPHIGSRTYETREGMGRLVLENLIAHFDGQPLISRVA